MQALLLLPSALPAARPRGPPQCLFQPPPLLLLAVPRPAGDLKCANVIITQAFAPRVADLGLSGTVDKFLRRKGAGGSGGASDAAAKGPLDLPAGTLRYLAPELLNALASEVAGPAGEGAGGGEGEAGGKERPSLSLAAVDAVRRRSLPLPCWLGAAEAACFACDAAAFPQPRVIQVYVMMAALTPAFFVSSSLHPPPHPSSCCASFASASTRSGASCTSSLTSALGPA